MRLFVTALIFSALFSSGAQARTKILAQVNDDIVSEMDLENRLAFIRLTGQADVSRKDVRRQILKQLIDEKLKQQEGKNAGIEIGEEEIRHATEITLKQNGLDYNAVLKTLKENGLPVSVIEDQIKSDLMFVRAVKKNAGLRAEISDREVDLKLEEINDQMNRTQYLVSKISLPVPSPDRDDEVYGQAMQLIMRLRDGEEFDDVAAGYSSEKGVWIAEDTLSAEEKEAFSALTPGEATLPVKTPDGYKVFVLLAMRNPEEVRKKYEAVHLLQLFLPASFSEKRKAAVLRELNMTKGSCEQFKTVAEQLKTSPRVDLGKLPLENLPPPIRSTINRTPLLEPSRPLPIEGGEIVLMACSRENVSALPAKEEIKMQLEGAKIDALAQRRLRELRRTAVTEIRQ